jgi:predicted nucleotidyltransferase
MTELYLHKVREKAQLRLQKIIADLAHAEALVSGRASVYATGSFGRLEAGELSDLDLFVVVETVKENDKEKRLLNNIDEINLKYQIITVAEQNSLPKFDGGGKFLASHTVISYTEWLGTQEDDYRNTLTGRMLLLLESQVLIGESVYEKTILNVISKYFRDFEGHEANFLPSFLFNDILRMWRTFCVNYEGYRKDGNSRNKIKNLKLKFSRMLTCYSAIVYLLAIYAKNSTVRPDDVREMVSLTPTRRLERLADCSFWGKDKDISIIQQIVFQALDGYSQFLELTHLEEKKAAKKYDANEVHWRERSYIFGESLSSLVDVLGKASGDAGRLRRLIII